MKIGIISDTHGLLRPEVIRALEGCGAVLHAGDVGSKEVLEEVRAIALLYAVQGNVDGGMAAELPSFLEVQLAGLRIYMTHNRRDLPKDLTPYDLVVTGHSHQYEERWMPSGSAGRGKLQLNPGSCGPKRFHLPATMAVLEETGGSIDVRRIEIKAAAERIPRIRERDLYRQIEIVMRETEKGRSPEEIARRRGMDPAVADQIARLYVTHPGITGDGILTRMGLLEQLQLSVPRRHSDSDGGSA